MLWGASQRRGRSVRGRRAVFQPRQPMVMMALAAVTALLQCVGVSAQCATVPSDGLSICSMWNGRPMYEGISSSAEQLASLDQRAKAMVRACCASLPVLPPAHPHAAAACARATLTDFRNRRRGRRRRRRRPASVLRLEGPGVLRRVGGPCLPFVAHALGASRPRIHCFDGIVFTVRVCVCVGLPVQVVEMQLDNAETPTVSEADALACSASALSVPTFSNCTTAVSDTCSVNVVRLRPTATPQPSPSPLPPNVVGAVRPAIVFNEPVSGMRMPLGPFCACRFVLLLLLLLLLLAVALCVRTFVLTTCV